MHKTIAFVNLYPRNLFILTAGIGMAFISVNCAHQGSLSGGVKDVDPPKVVEAKPANRTTSFMAKRVDVTFNEFIQLKNPGKEIFMSPPMKEKPEFKVHGKDLIIEFKEELKENTTYTINFGNALVDYTESNPFPNFEYVFSTGDVIDSLSISGKVLNAFDLKPEPDLIAMVYTDDNDSLALDSLPLKVQPKSASRTDKDGRFSINNLPPGEYKLIALQDFNSNFYYDLPNERIAFLDSLVTLVSEVADTLPEVVEDTITGTETDTLYRKPFTLMPKISESYILYIFEEKDSTQKLLGKKLIGTDRLQYCFRMPLDTLSVSLLDSIPGTGDWYMPEFSKDRDTVDLWLKPGLPDTIRVVFHAADSLVDTSKYSLKPPERIGRLKKDEVLHAEFRSNVTGGKFDIQKELIMTFTSPLKSFDSSRTLLKSSEDSLSPSMSYGDDIPRTVIIHHPWKEGESYTLTIDDSAFIDQNGLANDSITLGFRVRSAEDYGVLIMNIEIPMGKGQYIIQLLDKGKKVLQEKHLSKSGLVRFEYLLPASYELKAIHDRDGNNKWNSGNYRQGLLPESVQYYPGGISIRANWDLQEDWKLGEN